MPLDDKHAEWPPAMPGAGQKIYDRDFGQLCGHIRQAGLLVALHRQRCLEREVELRRTQQAGHSSVASSTSLVRRAVEQAHSRRHLELPFEGAPCLNEYLSGAVPGHFGWTARSHFERPGT